MFFVLDNMFKMILVALDANLDCHGKVIHHITTYLLRDITHFLSDFIVELFNEPGMILVYPVFLIFTKK